MLIPDWRQAWRWWSVRVAALGAILLAAAIAAPEFVASVWQLLPAAITADLPVRAQLAIPLALQLATIVARLLRQRRNGGEA
jgi:membrane protein implicated in regulation of membrane protease activity